MALAYYTMYPRDFDSDENVRSMTLAGVGMFILLLNHSWVNDGLPEDPEMIRKVLKCDTSIWANLWLEVEPCFPVFGDGRRRNQRLEKERVKAEEAHDKKVRSGQKGAEAKKGRRKQGLSTASAMLRQKHEAVLKQGLSNQNQNQNQITHSVSDAREPAAVRFEVEDPVIQIEHWIKQFGEAMGVDLKPDQAVCFRLARAMFEAGKTLADFEAILRDLVERKQKPKGIGWVIAVIEGQLGGKICRVT